MPRLVHQNPKYRHHRASGQAVVTVDGQDFYLGLYGTQASRDEYDRIIGEWLAASRRLQPVGGIPDLSIAELLVAYWRFAKDYYAPMSGKSSGERDAIRAVMKLLKTYARTPVSKFGPLSLKAVREGMIKIGWARTHINGQTKRIRRIFRWGVENELVAPSILHGLQAVAGLRIGKTTAAETEPVLPVPLEHIHAILPHVSAQVKAMIELQLLTGMRPGEVCAMRGIDIDTTGKLWIYRLKKHKTAHHGHEREIYLGPRAQAILAPLLKPELSVFVFSAADAEMARRKAMSEARKTPANFGNRPGTNRKRKPRRMRGHCYTVHSYRRAITTGCEIAFGMPEEIRRPPSTKDAAGHTIAETQEAQKVRQAKAGEWRAQHCWHPPPATTHRRYRTAKELRPGGNPSDPRPQERQGD